MKRRIDLTQLQQLTDEQKQKLREWWKPEEGDFCVDESNDNHLITRTDDDGWIFCGDFVFLSENRFNLYPLLSISQMIELLESKDQCLNITKRTDLEGWGYEIKLRHIDYYNFSAGEFCDALWEAVKSIL